MVEMGQPPVRRLSDRQVRIMEIVSAEPTIKVADLAERLNVSTVTMRSDVDGLTERGIVRHDHGLVVRLPHTDVAGRQAIAYREKLCIARMAASDIAGDATLMVGGGSTCTLFARELAMRRIEVRIVTNSVFLANDIRHAQNIEVTLLGGSFQRQSQVNVGPLVSLCAANVEADSLVAGIGGWDPELGPMCSDLFEAAALRVMAQRAQSLIIVADSSKFCHRSVVPLGIDLDGAAVVTDAGVPDETVRSLRERGTRLIVCHV